jgi:hypothetical protein
VPFAQGVGLQEISVLKVIQISFGFGECLLDLLCCSGVNFGLDIIPIVVFKTDLKVFIGLNVTCAKFKGSQSFALLAPFFELCG